MVVIGDFKSGKNIPEKSALFSVHDILDLDHALPLIAGESLTVATHLRNKKPAVW